MKARPRDGTADAERSKGKPERAAVGKEAGEDGGGYSSRGGQYRLISSTFSPSNGLLRSSCFRLSRLGDWGILIGVDAPEEGGEGARLRLLPRTTEAYESLRARRAGAGRKAEEVKGCLTSCREYVGALCERRRERERLDPPYAVTERKRDRLG